jgi:hypothetical protein
MHLGYEKQNKHMWLHQSTYYKRMSNGYEGCHGPMKKKQSMF